MTRRRRPRRIARAALVLLAVYLLIAYLALPRLWTHYEHDPGLEGRSFVTVTADGIPGDPLNVGLVGSKEEAIRALTEAGWYPADAVSFKTSVEIAGSVLFDRPFRDAPVSPLFYQGKEQAFAFEKPVGHSADKRNHVRFFATSGEHKDGRPLWLGSATFDRGVGVSHYTGEITHHIAPDIDAERDLLMRDLATARVLTELFDVSGIGPTLFGRNGGGDRYYTDGDLRIGVVTAGAVPAAEPPRILADPPAVIAKDALFAQGKQLLSAADDRLEEGEPSD